MERKLKVSAVSYLNTAPFVFGLKHSETAKSIDLKLDYPAECARKLLADEVQIGLVPIYSIINRPNFEIVSNYCIGSNGIVRTVSLLSNAPLTNISIIYLDSHSQTSINLIKVLAKNFWEKEFIWKNFDSTINVNKLQNNEALLAIGDKVFTFESMFRYNIDLATEWQKFTGLPMVFAVWASKNNVNPEFVKHLDSALAYGVSQIENSINPYLNEQISKDEAYRYLTQNISYTFDDKKKQAFNLYKRYVNSL